MQIVAEFPLDGSILNLSNLVWIGLAFPKDQFHFELILQNCAGDICLAGVQENNGRAIKLCQSLFFKLHSLPIQTHWNCSTCFHGTLGIQKQTQLELISSPKWNDCKQSGGNARPMLTQNVTVSVEVVSRKFRLSILNGNLSCSLRIISCINRLEICPIFYSLNCLVVKHLDRKSYFLD